MGGGRDASPQKLYGGDGYIIIPQCWWLTGQPSGPQHNQIAPAYSEPIGLITVDSTSSSFTSVSKISISLRGSSVRLPIGSSPLDPTGWLPSPRIPSLLRQSIPQSYRAVDATESTYYCWLRCKIKQSHFTVPTVRLCLYTPAMVNINYSGTSTETHIMRVRYATMWTLFKLRSPYLLI